MTLIFARNFQLQVDSALRKVTVQEKHLWGWTRRLKVIVIGNPHTIWWGMWFWCFSSPPCARFQSGKPGVIDFRHYVRAPAHGSFVKPHLAKVSDRWRRYCSFWGASRTISSNGIIALIADARQAFREWCVGLWQPINVDRVNLRLKRVGSGHESILR
jgi:hypothetical protein